VFLTLKKVDELCSYDFGVAGHPAKNSVTYTLTTSTLKESGERSGLSLHQPYRLARGTTGHQVCMSLVRSCAEPTLTLSGQQLLGAGKFAHKIFLIKSGPE